MENLVEKVNEKFLGAILEAQDPTRLSILVSAYRDFICAAKAMQDMELDFDDWLYENECCQF